MEPVFFDGDALTEERSRNIQWVFKDGDNQFDRIEGLDPVHTDWHAKVKLYEVICHSFSKVSCRGKAPLNTWAKLLKDQLN